MQDKNIDDIRAIQQWETVLSAVNKDNQADKDVKIIQFIQKYGYVPSWARTTQTISVP